MNFDLGNRLFVLVDASDQHETLFSKPLNIKSLADTLVLFEDSDILTVTIGSFGTNASFKGTLGAISLKCAA